MKVALVFLLAVAFVSASVPARRPLPAHIRPSVSRDLSLNRINQFLANLHQQLLPLFQQIQTAAEQTGQDLSPSISNLLEAFQSGDYNTIKDAVNQLIVDAQVVGQQFAVTLQNVFEQFLAVIQATGGLKAADRNFLVDMLINAIIGSSSFQNLLKSDPTIVCLQGEGHNINADFIMETIANNAHHFVIVQAQNCINQNGGLQQVVQTSPLIQFAWKTAKSFGMLKTVRKAIVEKLGADLGNEVIGYLDNNPHARDLSAILENLPAIIALIQNNIGTIITLVQNNLPQIIALVQGYLPQIIAAVQQYLPVVIQFVQENIGAISAFVQANASTIISYIEQIIPMLPEHIQTIVVPIVQHVLTTLGVNGLLRY